MTCHCTRFRYFIHQEKLAIHNIESLEKSGPNKGKIIRKIDRIVVLGKVYMLRGRGQSTEVSTVSELLSELVIVQFE